MKTRLTAKHTCARRIWLPKSRNMQTTHRSKLATPAACILRMSRMRLRRLAICWKTISSVRPGSKRVQVSNQAREMKESCCVRNHQQGSRRKERAGVFIVTSIEPKCQNGELVSTSMHKHLGGNGLLQVAAFTIRPTGAAAPGDPLVLYLIDDVRFDALILAAMKKLACR